jgi:hypothetical protein
LNGFVKYTTGRKEEHKYPREILRRYGRLFRNDFMTSVGQGHPHVS